MASRVTTEIVRWCWRDASGASATGDMGTSGFFAPAPPNTSSHDTCAVICIRTSSSTTAHRDGQPGEPLEEERIAEEHEEQYVVVEPAAATPYCSKAAEGHDEPLTAEQAANLVGDERFAEAERISIELYRTAAEYAAGKGIIIADTKFELGLDEQGNVVLGDEAFTPDSSRFWPADEYEPGGPQPSYDKQFVRDYAESLVWDKAPPGPELPDEVVTGTRARYLEAFEQITGIPFGDYATNPQAVLR